MKTLLTFLSILLIHYATAQTRIVKDNIACLYGVKDNSGNWVIPCEYTLISTTAIKNQYRLLKENKIGLADVDGKILLEPQFNQIVGIPNTTEYYFIGKGKERGVMDYTGKILIEPGKYDQIFHIYKDYFRGKNSEKEYLLKKDKLVYSESFDLVQAYIINGKYYFNLQKNKKSTQLLLEDNEKNDTAFLVKKGTIENYSNHFIIVYEDSTLIFDSEKKLKYRLKFKKPLYKDIFFSINKTHPTFRFYENGKYGLANTENKILVPSIYQEIQDRLGGNPKMRYQISQNGLIGFMNTDFEVTLTPEHKWISLTNYHKVLLFSKNGKIALFDEEINQLTPFQFQLTNNDYQAFVYDSADIYCLNFNQSVQDSNLANGYLTKGTFEIKLGDLFIYKFDTGLKAFYKTRNEFNSIPNSSVLSNNEGYSLYYNSHTLLYDKEGKALNPKPQKSTLPFTPIDEKYSIRMQNQLYGIIDENENWVVEPNYENISLATGNTPPAIWIKKEKNKDCRFKESYTGNWYYCYPNGDPIIDWPFDLPTYIYSVPTIVYTRNKCGLYSFLENKFIIEPTYNLIHPYYGNSNNYILYDENWDFQVAQKDGKLIVEDKWNYMVVVNRNTRGLSLPDIGLKDYTFLNIFLNETDTIAITYLNDTITHSAFLKELIHQGNVTNLRDPLNNHLGYNYLSYPKESQNNSEYIHTNDLFINYFNYQPETNYTLSDYPSILDETIDYLLKNDKYGFKYKPLPDYIETNFYIRSFYQNEIKCYVKLITPTQPLPINGEIQYCDENHVSLFNSRATVNSQFVNLYRAYGYLFEFGLKDIFRSDVNIEDAMIILLTESIHDREDLFLNCHNPATIFDRTGKNFLFDERGLRFYLRDERGASQEIIIPWKKLKKYAFENGIVAEMLEVNSPQN